MGIVFYFLKYFQEGVAIAQGIFFALIVAFFIGMAVISRKNKKQNKQTKKKWLLKEIIFGYSSFAGIMNIPIQLVLYLPEKNNQDWYLDLLSFLLVVLSLMMYVVLIVIPSQADNYLKATYPEYALIENV